MGSQAGPFHSLIRHFPRGHLLLAGTLSAALTLTIALLPESGASSGEDAGATSAALELPPPQRQQDATTSEPAQEREWTEIEVSSGDTLARLLGAEGVSPGEIHRLVTADEHLEALGRIRPGERFRIYLDDDGKLAAVQHQKSRTRTLHAERTDAGWESRMEEREYERHLRYAHGTIEDSLFLAGRRAGLDTSTTMQLAHIFGWNIDFIMDIRKGDEFRLLYEELFLDGEKVGEGNILMAEFRNRDREFSAFRYELADGEVDYFDEEGNSMRRAFLRNPVDFTRISSRFNLNRRHPVLNTMRAHRGVDYAAPTGTEVRAAGDGRVKFAGRRGGYGNVVILRHGGKYSTLYAHLNRFSVRTGQRVRQGQTIGEVGMTGMATGPHLHYEFRVNGRHRDPLRVELPEAEPLPEKHHQDFRTRANRLAHRMALHQEAIALASSSE